MSTGSDWLDLSYEYVLRFSQQKLNKPGFDRYLQPKSLEVYNYIVHYLNRFKTFPDSVTLQKDLPDLQYYKGVYHQIDSKDLIQRIRKYKTLYDAQEFVGQVQQVLIQSQDQSNNITEEDIMEKCLQFQTRIFQNAERPINYLSQANSIAGRLQQQDNRTICNFGISSLDDLTRGIKQSDYIIIYGNTGQGKSTLARHIAGNIAGQGKKAIYFTLEEPADESVLRVVSTQIQVGFNEILEQRYTNDGYARLVNFKSPGEIAFIDNLSKHYNSEIMQHMLVERPDVIFLDQIPHLLKKSNKAIHEEITYISTDLRQLAQTSRIPIIALTQANVKGTQKNPTLEQSMAYAYSQARDAVVIIFVHPDQEESDSHIKKITVLKSRRGKSNQSFSLKWNIANGIIEEEHRILNMPDNTGGLTHEPISIPSFQQCLNS